MIQLIVRYIKTHSMKCYEEKGEEMLEVDTFSEKEDAEVYEWYFYNEIAEQRFLGEYYSNVEEISPENISRMNELYKTGNEGQ